MVSALTSCGGTSAAAATATAGASRPIVISSTNTPGPNAPSAPASGPAVPGSTVLTPFATTVAAQPTAAALLTVISSAAGQIRIADFSFTPPSSSVTSGTAVIWTNAGPSNHTVTANDGSFDSGTIQVNGKFSFTPTKPGSYAYHCTIHPTMQGTLVVA
jgi:plastocyanin